MNTQSESFQAAVADAEVLLRHATETGRALEASTIACIVEVRHLQAETVPAEVEERFWYEYERLASVLQPITATSLRDCSAKQMPWVLSIITGLLIAMVVSFQALWAIGMNLASELHENISQMQQLRAKSPLTEEELLTRENLNIRGQALVDALEGWNRPLSNSLLGVFHTVTFNTPNKENDELEADPAQKTQVMLIQVKITLDFLQTYILPLLYGLLGAFAYVLRHISFNIRNKTYTHQTFSDYLLRVTMGCISGFVIAWFVFPPTTENIQQANILASLSPFALAFIAGYSIELLFSIMDKIIAPFIVQHEEKRRKLSKA